MVFVLGCRRVRRWGRQGRERGREGGETARFLVALYSVARILAFLMNSKSHVLLQAIKKCFLTAFEAQFI